MFNIKNRTEFSFRWAYGHLDQVLACNKTAAAMTDRHNTYGHVAWNKACKKANIKPLFGVELAVVQNMEERTKQATNYMTLLALNNDGLKEIYDMVGLATEKFYHVPRIDYEVVRSFSDNIIILSGHNPNLAELPVKKNLYIEMNPNSNPKLLEFAKQNKVRCVATSDNFYPKREHKKVYEMCVDGLNMNDGTKAMHILDEWEWRLALDWLDEKTQDECLKNSELIAESCTAELQDAELVKPEDKFDLTEMCIEGAKYRKINLEESKYKERLEMELRLIANKKYEDYFFVVADLVKYAKQHMLVGPARGSSCGSLVCYLIGITDIDPIPFNLLFERFIDLNRMDLPDIDIDFPDSKREMVFIYLQNKYGNDRVARLGTVMRYKAKSTIQDVAKKLSIPKWEIDNFKDAIIERSSGDARASFCIMDTFNELDIGKATLKKYPELAIAAEIENHARQSGIHAAGIIVSEKPLINYCSVDIRSGAIQMDKSDAEKIGLLKIDVLGLRTLSVIDDTLNQINKDKEWLLNYPLDDIKAFDILNDGKFSGIFQYEGDALQFVCRQMKIEHFEDVAALTALARPGPFKSGGTAEFLKRRTGQNKVTYLHPTVQPITEVTYGVVVYQEQVMQIAREVGKLSWEDVSNLRKAMSKSLGKEFFDTFWVRFEVGALENGLNSEDAKLLWDNINTMGSWAFNRSHAVAYGMMSYWCMVLKAHFPLEYAAACLRNAKDEEQSIQILRELVNEGFSYKNYDKDLSELNWTVKDGKLIGGLTGIKGIGEKKALNILHRRNTNQPLTPALERLLTEGVTPYDSVFQGKDYWGHVSANPFKYNINSKLFRIEQIKSDTDGEVCFIAKLKEKNLRDHNEQHLIDKRGYEMKGQTNFLMMTLEDDTDRLMAMISRQNYLKYGKPIIEGAKLDEWFIWKGKTSPEGRMVYIERWIKMTGNPKYAIEKLEEIK